MRKWTLRKEQPTWSWPNLHVKMHENAWHLVFDFWLQQLISSKDLVLVDVAPYACNKDSLHLPKKMEKVGYFGRLKIEEGTVHYTNCEPHSIWSPHFIFTWTCKIAKREPGQLEASVMPPSTKGLGQGRANLARDRTQNPRSVPERRTPKATLATPGRSFLTAVAGRIPLAVAPCKTQPGIVFSPTPNTVSWLTHCTFGVLRSPQDNHKVQELFTSHGVEGVTVSRAGDRSVLVCFPSTLAMSQFFLQESDWVQAYFISLEPWRQGLGPVNRSCWISVRGIPLQAWCKDFFTLVALFIGDLVCVAEETLNRTRLDCAKLRVITYSSHPISKTVPVMVDGQSYDTFISESSPCCDLQVNPAGCTLSETTPEPRFNSEHGPQNPVGNKPITNDLVESRAESTPGSPDPFRLMPIIQKCAIQEENQRTNKEVGGNPSVESHPPPPSGNSARDCPPQLDPVTLDIGFDKPIQIFNSFSPLANTEAQEQALDLAIQQRRVTVRKRAVSHKSESLWASSSEGVQVHTSPASSECSEYPSSLLTPAEQEAFATLQIGQELG
ncbi:hypothetical protein Tsubulata_047480 [Turnera subulata]|uniref:DUF4283 domain-containing protein n=1 Tax=Turnera subulata TaxID=218843 RepID=A0A9Q0G5F5_9ROSI|nr:hypothetical protein Tsubulata_047480 [Turnera subulata]